MLPRFSDAGLETTTVFFELRPTGIERELVRGGLDVRHLPSNSRRGRVQELRRIIRSEHPDIVHTTLFEADLVGRLAATLREARVLTSLVNTPYVPARMRDPRVNRARLQAVRLLDAWTARHLTHSFHAITHAVKDSAVRTMRIPPERITVVERGRDRTRLGEPGLERRNRVRASLGLDRGARVILNVGRQEYQKGQRYLIEAFDAVSERVPDAVLLVAGRTGHCSAELESLTLRSPAKERIRLLGYRDDVPDLLAAADVFAFPSLYEGLGGAVIEAMALGLPVVASDIPPVREVVAPQESALLVPPENSVALADALLRVLDDHGMATALGARGLRIFEERFTLEGIVSRMINLYRATVAVP
jgi:glycosyltransferase involved in cell wall biosynthesis